MPERPVLLSTDGPISTVTINRPVKRDALSRAVWQGLTTAIGHACAQSATRVVVVRGAGGDFAVGADIGEFDTVFADRAATLAYLETMTTTTEAIATAPVPVIAAIQGLCIGAGVAVALACDLRIAARGASFAVTPAKLGLVYSLTDTRRLTAAVGMSNAKDLLFTGDRIGVERALEIGLIDHVGGDETVASKAATIASTSAWTHAHTKRMMLAIGAGTSAERDETRGWFADAPEAGDFRAGLAAFFARSPPRFPPRSGA